MFLAKHSLLIALIYCLLVSVNCAQQSHTDTTSNVDYALEKFERIFDDQHSCDRSICTFGSDYNLEKCLESEDGESSLFLASSRQPSGSLYNIRLTRVKDYNQVKYISCHLIALRRAGGHPHCSQLVKWGPYNDNNFYIVKVRDVHVVDHTYTRAKNTFNWVFA